MMTDDEPTTNPPGLLLLTLLHAFEQLAVLARYHHARGQAMTRQVAEAMQKLKGRPTNRLRFKGRTPPATLARRAAVQFAIRQAGFDKVCRELGADPAEALAQAPHGEMILALGDELIARAGRLDETAVAAVAEVLRIELRERRPVDATITAVINRPETGEPPV
jgi:hypothetical protein